MRPCVSRDPAYLPGRKMPLLSIFNQGADSGLALLFTKEEDAGDARLLGVFPLARG